MKTKTIDYGIRITEKDFRQQVIDLAKILGYKTYFTWTSIHSPRGMPDLILCRPPRIIFAELKTEKGQVSPHQQEWIDLLRECGGNVECYLWRPADIENIAELLSAATPMQWYQYRSKDGRVRGYCPGKSEDDVARFANYPKEELIIKRAVWVLEELREVKS